MTVNDTQDYIAKKIRELRIASGLTQTQLAQKLKVTPNTVSRWESGTYRPRTSDLELLARAFGQAIWVFFPSEVKPATEQHRALLSATGDLPPEDIDELIRYADFVRMRRALEKKKRKRPSD